MAGGSPYSAGGPAETYTRRLSVHKEESISRGGWLPLYSLMTRQILEEDIAASPFLLGLSEHQLRLLSDCATRTHFVEDQIIFRQGDTANRFYLIRKGIVSLEATSESGGAPIAVETIGSGELLGWSWMFAPYECQFTARAVTETESIFFYGTVLREYCERDPALGFELVKRMSEVMIKRLQSARKLFVQEKTKFSSVGAEHAFGVETLAQSEIQDTH